MIRERSPAAGQQRIPEAQASPVPLVGGKINTCTYNYLLDMWPALSTDYILCNTPLNKTISPLQVNVNFDSFFLREWAHVRFPLLVLGAHLARLCAVPLHVDKEPMSSWVYHVWKSSDSHSDSYNLSSA